MFIARLTKEAKSFENYAGRETRSDTKNDDKETKSTNESKWKQSRNLDDETRAGPQDLIFLWPLQKEKGIR